LAEEFEIVKGDYGRTYRGVIEGEDLSDCTGVIFVWDEDDTKIIDGESCSVSLSGSDTHIDYTVQSADFATADPKKSYYGLFKLTKDGVVERTLSFTWKVYRKEP